MGGVRRRACKSAPWEPPHASTSSDAGLILGRYRPLRPLGSGGSASVWLARDEQEGREVALKVVRREGKAAARAEREVEAAARLRHPRCLRALALDRDDEHVYVAYEYVRGRTLREALRSRRARRPRRASRRRRRSSRGSRTRTAKRIVHRDVKPANVMLDEGDEISVAPPRLRARPPGGGRDAHRGRRRARARSPTSRPSGSRAGRRPPRPTCGRPASSSGRRSPAGIRSPPSSPIETARRIREGAQPLATLRPDLPADLCTLVDRMLDLDPRRRPAREAAPARAARRVRRDAAPPAPGRLARRRCASGPSTPGSPPSFAGGAALVLPFFPTRLAVRARRPRRRARAALAALRVSPLALAVPSSRSETSRSGSRSRTRSWPRRGSRSSGRGPRTASSSSPAPRSRRSAPSASCRSRSSASTTACARSQPSSWRRSPLRPSPRSPAASFPFGEKLATLDLAETTRPDVAAGAVASVAAAHSPGSSLVAAVLAAATLTVPIAKQHGLWGLAFWGSGFAAGMLLVPLAAGAVVSAPAVLPGIWAAVAWLAAPAFRRAETPASELPTSAALPIVSA